MEEKYTVFDVETPNGANDRICSIGISEIENGMIIESQNIFVNPECEFDSFNIHILLVGDEGSSAWIAGNYGTKVKKAMSLQEKGIPVTILRESDYFIK